MEGEEDSSRAIPGASLGGLPTPASRASFRLGSVFNGQEIGWDDAIATRRREEVREWESLGPGPVTEEQGTRGKEKDPDWRPAPGEAAGTSGGSGDEGWGGRGAGQAGGSGARGSGAAAKRPRPSGPVGSGAGGAGPASNSQPQGAAAGGSEGSGAAGAGTSAAAAGGAPLGGSTGAGAAAVIASQRSDRAGRTPTDEELDPWTEEVLRNAEPGLVRGMFSEKDVNEARNCKICKKKISWKGSCTSTGKRHLKRSHYPSLQIWCRRFKDPNKPDNLTFPDGGWGPDVPDQTAWPWEHAATWPRIVQTPDSAVTGGSEAGGSRQMSMAAFVTPRVHGQQLREGLVLLFAAADLPFRLVECREAYGEAAREDMRQLLVGDGLAGRMSLTFDIWTGENNVAFMGVTAHYVTSDFQLKQAVIDFRELKGSHTGDLIADELEEVLREWGLEKMLFAVTCDNAENNSRAMRLLAGVPDARPGSRPRHPPLLSRWRHFRCMAHVVNLAVQAALKVDEVAEPLKRLRDVANYIGWSTLRTDRFFELQKGYAATRPQGPPGSRRPSGPLRLIVDCVTRWGSTLHMVNRGFELRMPIAMFFDDSDYNALIDLQEKTQRTPGISPLRSSLITAALSKLERHMGGVSEEAAIATFLDPRQKLAPFKHRARAAEGNSRGTTLELGPDRVKALVRARLPEYQAASTTALRDGGEVTSARGAGVHASAGVCPPPCCYSCAPLLADTPLLPSWSWFLSSLPCCGSPAPLPTVTPLLPSLLWFPCSPPCCGSSPPFPAVVTLLPSLLWFLSSLPCCSSSAPLLAVVPLLPFQLWFPCSPPCYGSSPPFPAVVPLLLSLLWFLSSLPCCGSPAPLPAVVPLLPSLLWFTCSLPCFGSSPPFPAMVPLILSLLWFLSSPPCCGSPVPPFPLTPSSEHRNSTIHLL
ncbi:unnamed protein product [Closterium sp. NIES-65]|nr:unnamed protein product [Closterium sp. NIES-65]CAI6007156.1 unnamed protein product [Closterium sp. NIES-65]